MVPRLLIATLVDAGVVGVALFGAASGLLATGVDDVIVESAGGGSLFLHDCLAML